MASICAQTNGLCCTTDEREAITTIPAGTSVGRIHAARDREVIRALAPREGEQIFNWDPSFVELVPLKTSADHNCLCHAASLCIWGEEDDSWTIRTAVDTVISRGSEIQEEFKRLWKLEQLQQDVTNFGKEVERTEAQWVDEWEQEEYLARDEDSSLTEIHVFILCHILRRPIIVYCKDVVEDDDGNALAPIGFGGVYLPFLSPELKASRTPLMLAYHAAHFTALVPVDNPPGSRMPYNIVPLANSNGEGLRIHYVDQRKYEPNSKAWKGLLSGWMDIDPSPDLPCLGARLTHKRFDAIEALMAEYSSRTDSSIMTASTTSGLNHVWQQSPQNHEQLLDIYKKRDSYVQSSGYKATQGSPQYESYANTMDDYNTIISDYGEIKRSEPDIRHPPSKKDEWDTGYRSPTKNQPNYRTPEKKKTRANGKSQQTEIQHRSGGYRGRDAEYRRSGRRPPWQNNGWRDPDDEDPDDDRNGQMRLYKARKPYMGDEEGEHTPLYSPNPKYVWTKIDAHDQSTSSIDLNLSEIYSPSNKGYNHTQHYYLQGHGPEWPEGRSPHHQSSYIPKAQAPHTSQSPHMQRHATNQQKQRHAPHRHGHGHVDEAEYYASEDSSQNGTKRRLWDSTSNSNTDQSGHVSRPPSRQPWDSTYVDPALETLDPSSDSDLVRRPSDYSTGSSVYSNNALRSRNEEAPIRDTPSDFSGKISELPTDMSSIPKYTSDSSTSENDRLGFKFRQLRMPQPKGERSHGARDEANLMPYQQSKRREWDRSWISMVDEDTNHPGPVKREKSELRIRDGANGHTKPSKDTSSPKTINSPAKHVFKWSTPNENDAYDAFKMGKMATPQKRDDSMRRKVSFADKPKGNSKALLVGINYVGVKDHQLEGSIRDAGSFEVFLHSQGWSTDSTSMKVLTDYSRTLPTAQNIIKSMHWLVDGAEEGDALFFSFSGRGAQNGEHADTIESVLLAIDGLGITRQDLRTYLFERVPKGVQLTVVLDCYACIAPVNLPYVHVMEGHVRKEVRAPCSNLLEAGQVVLFTTHRKREYFRPSTIKHNMALELDGGVVSNAMLSILYEAGPSLTLFELLEAMDIKVKKRGLSDAPLLGTTHPIRRDTKFSFWPDFRALDSLPLRGLSSKWDLNPFIGMLRAEGIQVDDAGYSSQAAISKQEFEGKQRDTYLQLGMNDTLKDTPLQLEAPKNLDNQDKRGQDVEIAIRRLLKEVAVDATQKASRHGGFFKDMRVRIGFPDERDFLWEALEKDPEVQQMAEFLVKGMNAVAEHVAGVCFPLFATGIQDMPLDVDKIADGNASRFMEQKLGQQLAVGVLPLVEDYLQQYSIPKLWSDILDRCGSSNYSLHGFIEKFIAQGMVHGICVLMAHAEEEIRNKPSLSQDQLVQQIVPGFPPTHQGLNLD